VRSSAPRPGVIRFMVPWRPTGPLLSRTSVSGLPFDAMPLTTRRGDLVHLVLPGTSVRGALRTRAEFIERTLREVDPDSVPEAFVDQLDDPVLAVVHTVFGSASQKRGFGERAALTVHESESVHGIRAERWRSCLFDSWSTAARSGGNEAKKQAVSALHTAIRQLNDEIAEDHPETGMWFDLVTRNAIDRWTGGVAAGALFTSIEPYARAFDSWTPLVLDLDIDLIARRARARQATVPETGDGEDSGTVAALAALAMVLHLVRDLSDHRIPLGSGTNRGLGDVEIDLERAIVAFRPGMISVPGMPIASDEERLPSIADLLCDDDLVDALDGAWQSTMTANGSVSA
jgi:CRISPR/Cas system CSM-associated protein Csm3 (group 7 of RAMP superfamily)